MEEIIEKPLEEELSTDYLLYAVSVIADRATPDVRDGLKPVQRRILYSMYEMGITHDSQYRKSARIVGEVLGKYHPHGDKSVYDALVRMAQDFVMRYLLIDGQGNFGSIDKDPPAAMRYTEARLTKIAEEMLADIDKNTVDFRPNFDNTLQEPVVLPSKIPNLLVNGSVSIGIGISGTSIPPHNLSEVVTAIIEYIKNPDITIEELLKYIKGPDFPTGGVVIRDKKLLEAYEKGIGRVIVRARIVKEKTKRGDIVLVIKEIPYMVNKAKLIKSLYKRFKYWQMKRLKFLQKTDKKKNENVEELLNQLEQGILGIKNIRDESNKEGIRIVLELKKGVDPKEVVNALFKEKLPLRKSFRIDFTVLVGTQPKTLNLKELIHHFVEHRKEVVIRRTQYELKQAQDRLHLVEGFLKVILDIDKAISIIRNSETVKEAKENLMKYFGITEIQADAILDMRLQRLAKVEREKLEIEKKELLEKIRKYKEILENKEVLKQILIEELEEIKEKYGDARRTEIREKMETTTSEPTEEMQASMETSEVNPINIIITSKNRLTAIPTEKLKDAISLGKNTLSLEKGEYIKQVVNTYTNIPLLVITNKGNIYQLLFREIPIEFLKNLNEIISMEQEESPVSFVPLLNTYKYLLLVTKKGYAKRIEMKELQKTHNVIAQVISFSEEDDEVVKALGTTGNEEVISFTKSGNLLRIHENTIEVKGLSAKGVILMKLEKGDEIIDIHTTSDKKYIITISHKGLFKKMKLEEFSVKKTRMGKGVQYFKENTYSGDIRKVLLAKEGENILVVSSRKHVYHISVEEIPEGGHATAGKNLKNIPKTETILDAILI